MDIDKRRNIVKRHYEIGKLIKHTAALCKCSERTIKRDRKFLIDKGFFLNYVSPKCHPQNRGGSSRGVTSAHSIRNGEIGSTDIRLHGQILKIDVLEYISESIGYSMQLTLSGNTILFYESCVMIYSNTSFVGRNSDDCLKESFAYWYNLIAKIEDRYKVRLLKDGKPNVHIIREHYARISDETAIYHKDKGERLVVYDKDNKERLLTDYSLGKEIPETETVKRGKSKQDMDYYKAYMLDLLENKPELTSKIYQGLLDTIQGVNANAKQNGILQNQLFQLTEVVKNILKRL